MSAVKEAIDLITGIIPRLMNNALDVPDPGIIHFLVEIQYGLEPHIVLTPNNVEAMWSRVSGNSDVRSFVLNTTIYWRAAGAFYGPRWFDLTSNLSAAIDMGPVLNLNNPASTEKLSSDITTEEANQMTNRDLAFHYLNSNPWLVTLILMRFTASLLSTVPEEFKHKLRKEIDAASGG